MDKLAQSIAAALKGTDAESVDIHFADGSKYTIILPASLANAEIETANGTIKASDLLEAGHALLAAKREADRAGVRDTLNKCLSRPDVEPCEPLPRRLYDAIYRGGAK